MDRGALRTHIQAVGTYGIRSWDEKTWEGADRDQHPGKKLTRANIVFTFEGDFVGEGEVQFLMAYRDDTHASYVGLQRMTGRLRNVAGSFVMKVEGVFENGAATSTWTILPGLGTGDLAAISGFGQSVAEHRDTQPYSLDYYFES